MQTFQSFESRSCFFQALPQHLARDQVLGGSPWPLTRWEGLLGHLRAVSWRWFILREEQCLSRRAEMGGKNCSSQTGEPLTTYSVSWTLCVSISGN